MTADSQHLAERVVASMLAEDAFSRWLGLAVTELSPGRAVCRMTVRAEMANGFGVSHGAIQFALADSALAFASNSHGRLSLLIDASMSYPHKVAIGDELTATAEESSLGSKLAVYTVTVRNQHGATTGLFRGTVFRTGKQFFEGDSDKPPSHA